MTLVERVQSRRLGESGWLKPARDSERGKRRLGRWKSQPPFDSGALFQQRLEQGGLSEADLVELLSESDGAGTEHRGELSGWVLEVARAFAEAGDAESSLYPEKSGERPERRFLELIRPLITRARTRLRKGIMALAGSRPTTPFEPDAVETTFLELLPGRLLPTLARTMVLELNVARVQGLLTGETSEQRFGSFIERIKQPEIALQLFREYPVLARQIVMALDQWVGCSLEFLERWCADWPELRANFIPAGDPGLLVKIRGGVGDRHRGGRAVWIGVCGSGCKIVYKPKSMAVDEHFQELLGWLNERGVSAPFRQLKVLDRGAYGWEEFVSPEGCGSRKGVEFFYRRTGGYLALLYALAAADFHHENVLAVGEHPVLIDLEALFHRALAPEPQQASEVAEYSLHDSVLGAGLLPVPIWVGRNDGAYDVSGLGAQAGQKLPTHAAGWNGIGTDEMHFARRNDVIYSSDHRPTLNGADTTPLDYRDGIEAGFEEVYRILEKHQSELLAPGGVLGRFANDEVRVVLRSTSRYGELLREGSHPDVLRDALDRDRLFDRLWEGVKDWPHLAQFIPAEIDELWRENIPLFTTRPGSRDLWADADRRFAGVLPESGLELARRRLERFGPKDLKRQLWLLRGSLATLVSVARPALGPRRRDLAEPTAGVDRRRLLAASCAIGDQLVSTAFRDAEEAAWIGLSMVQQKQWVLSPVGIDLYDGVAGIALYLACLGKISGQQRYSELARAALKTIRRRLQPDKRGKGQGEIGGFIGWGGLLYTLPHLATLWNERGLLDQAYEWLEELPERVGQDKDLDIIGGAAGCIAGLLCLQACRPSGRILEVATQCGDHLLAQARPMAAGLGWDSFFPGDGPLTGFSHGAGGIAWALLELAAVTGEGRFKTAALGGIAYERSLFSTEAGNWPDLRVFDTTAKQESAEPLRFQVTWCHGAPGIGLARLLCRRLLADPLLEEEIEVALRTTRAKGFGSNHSLCHGDLGNLELFLEAARAFPESSWGAEANRLAAIILQSIERNGWLCGNPLAVESPGLMTGLAGIGYGLLRCTEPDRVPSVLCLSPPGNAHLGPEAHDVVNQCNNKQTVQS